MTERYNRTKRRLWGARDFNARLKLIYLIRGLAWQREQQKAVVSATANKSRA